ncbi:hypothetical protein KUL150_21130 [Alteromonas sp. KUL150]|uniref:glycosyltransferase 61 family protein n=1 Tax=Alteromonas sp. KUL150 TaxID=2480805 RepID=UPI0012E5206B|nr:glycosyltransferase 61 family protein [Alteromonas sp. KUL150]GFD86054.1 hypothetical protein KUL150_21130 [Alteromonas sp. KUL150]
MLSIYNALEINSFKSPFVFGSLNVTDSCIGNRSICEAKLIPNHYKRGMRTWWTRRSQGVFDKDGNHLEALSDIRSERRIWWPNEETYSTLSTAQFERYDEAFYGGTIYDHFGHFLLDSLSRLYPILNEVRASNSPILFHYPLDSLDREKVLNSYVGEFLAILGLAHEKIVFIDKPLLVSKLYYHGATFSDANFVTDSIKSSYPCLSQKPKVAKRGFISKSKLQAGTGFTSQGEEIDEIFESLGFDIIYPESIPLQDQIDIMQSYDVLLGFPSSFFHLKLFCKEGAKLLIMFPEIDEFLHTNFLNIDVGAEFYDSYIPLAAETADAPPGFAKGFKLELSQIYEIARLFC